MSPLLRRTLFVPLFLLFGVASVSAQETDTSTTEPAAPDTMTADTAEAAPMAADTADADTMAVDTTAADTTRRMAADTTRGRADSLAAVRREQATTALADSVAARRNRLATRRATAKEAARAAADKWLALTDEGEFEESWRVADSTLQKGIGQEAWGDQGRRVRSRLDSVLARRLTQTQYRDSTALLPGRHPVVLLQYETTFDRGTALEAVVTTKEDTTWKVAGYRMVSMPDTIQADTTQADTTQVEEQ